MKIVKIKDRKYGDMEKYNRHGGAWDRGSADAWYGRDFDPHYFIGGTYTSEKITEYKMSLEEIEAYTEGYDSVPFGSKYL